MRPYPSRVRPQEIRLAALIATLVFFDLAIWLTAIPLIPVWERDLGLTHTQSGIVLGSYGIAVLFLSLPAGHLADRLGARRLTIGATCCSAATVPLYGFASSFERAARAAARERPLLRRLVDGRARLAGGVGARRVPRPHARDRQRDRGRRVAGGAADRRAAGRGDRAEADDAGASAASSSWSACGRSSSRTAAATSDRAHLGHRARCGSASASRGSCTRSPASRSRRRRWACSRCSAPIHLSDLGLSSAGIGWIWTTGAAVSLLVAAYRRPPARPDRQAGERAHRRADRVG